MDKDAVLSHLQKRACMSTLLGGEVPVNVFDNNKYISPLTCDAEETQRSVEDDLPTFDHTVHAALSGDNKKVILVGREGSGKTTMLEKLVVDWARGEYLKNFSFVVHFRLFELNAFNGAASLEMLLLHHHIPPESITVILQKPQDVLFVIDDLDQCKQSLDQSVHNFCSDLNQMAPLSSVVASLLHGSLLNGAAFVVAARSPECVKLISGTQVKVLGFLKPQREAYFKRFFTEPAVANKALMHMEKTLGFYDFSTSPRFCWTVCSMYKSLMEAGEKLPETLSQLYVALLVHLIQLNEACNREAVVALGKMASHCFLGQRSCCTKEEMDSFGFQQSPTSLLDFLKSDENLTDERIFFFHSQMVQEFLLAVYLFLDQSASEGVEEMLKKYKGHAEFLELFLSALSEPMQRGPLGAVLGELNSSQIADFKSWFKSTSEETLKGYHKERHHHCFHLLHEAQSESLVREIVTPSARLGLSYADLSLRDCVALNYVATCLGEMEQLNLYRTMNLTAEEAEVLAPTMSLSHKIILLDSSLSTGAVRHLASALSQGLTTELDLSRSHLGDEKLKLLCAGLRACKLHELKLAVCDLTERSAEDLASVLTADTSQLRVLDLRFNDLGDWGFCKLFKALHSPNCKLQEIELQSCELTATSMEALSEALCSGHSRLQKVDFKQCLSDVSGVEPLCKALQHPLCKLQRVILSYSELESECFPPLMKALMSEHCSLLELDLTVNYLDHEGVLLLCQALSRAGCSMEKLGLTRCELTQEHFEKLASVLKSGTSKLKSLAVGLNKVGDGGVQHLWDALAHPNCRLEELDVEMTDLTDATVDNMCAAIRASKTLKILGLKNNALSDASVPALVQVMQDSDHMQDMDLDGNDLSEDAFEKLEQCEKIRY